MATGSGCLAIQRMNTKWIAATTRAAIRTSAMGRSQVIAAGSVAAVACVSRRWGAGQEEGSTDTKITSASARRHPQQSQFTEWRRATYAHHLQSALGAGAVVPVTSATASRRPEVPRNGRHRGERGSFGRTACR